VDGVLVPRTVGVTQFPVHGRVDVDRTTGAITYTPNAGFSGADRFAYAALDNAAAFSNEAHVSVIVTGRDYPWHNPVSPLDVNDDGSVAPVDALLIIHDLMQHSPRRLPIPRSPTEGAPPFVDTNRDGYASAVDALMVIGRLTSPQPAKERDTSRGALGGSELVVPAPDATPTGKVDQSIPVNGCAAGQPVSARADDPSGAAGEAWVATEPPEVDIGQSTAGCRARRSARDPATQRDQDDYLSALAQDVAHHWRE
jgi:hypothetical protein